MPPAVGAPSLHGRHRAGLLAAGLGRLVFQAIANRDLPVVRNVVMLLAAMVVVINFIVDVLYVVIDPRLRARARDDVSARRSRALAPRQPARRRRARRARRRPGAALVRLDAVSAGRARHPAQAQPPSASHWLGTDSLGRDIVSLLIVGSRVSIAVGVIAVGIGIVVGVALGLLAAVRRGWVEELVMRLADFTFAFPALLSAIMLTAIYGPGLVTSIVAIGIFNIPVFARITRASALVVRSREFVTAARALGKGEWRITLEHVLPNIAAILIVQATIQFALAILAEAALSYLGLGTQPPTPSWGRMLNEAQQQLFQAPQLAVYPGIAIALTCSASTCSATACATFSIRACCATAPSQALNEGARLSAALPRETSPGASTRQADRGIRRAAPGSGMIRHCRSPFRRPA